MHQTAANNRIIRLNKLYATWCDNHPDDATWVAFCKHARINPDFLRQCRTQWQDRKMGDRTARKLEKSFDKPNGWMDMPLVLDGLPNYEQLKLGDISDFTPDEMEFLLRTIAGIVASRRRPLKRGAKSKRPA